MFSKLLDKVESATGVDIDGDGNTGGEKCEGGETRDACPEFKPSGNKKALLIGINYIGHAQGRLNGCINDTENIQEFLASHGYDSSNIRRLNDDNPEAMPTRDNIIAGINWLVSGASPGDAFFFHYSGHGSQSKASLLDSLFEGDSMDETICPSDYDKAGMITDNELNKLMVKPLPEGCKLTCIFDSCHSGSVLDLPFLYEAPADDEYHGEHESGFLSRHKVDVSDMLTRGVAGIQAQVAGVLQREILHHGSKFMRKNVSSKMHASKADVVQFAGCRDEQTSADTTALSGGVATGAMSFAFIATLANAKDEMNYTTLIRGMRDVLHKGAQKFTQMPQMSFGRQVDPDQTVYF